MLLLIKYRIFALMNLLIKGALLWPGWFALSVFTQFSFFLLLLGFVLCAACLSLLRRFPFGQHNQTDRNSAVVSHNSLFLPVSSGRVLRATRWVYSECLSPPVIFTMTPMAPSSGRSGYGKWMDGCLACSADKYEGKGIKAFFFHMAF